MNTRQKQSIEMYQRVQDFVQVNQVPVGAAGTLLGDVVTQLVTHGRDQQSGVRLSRHASQRRASLLATLRSEHLRPIATVASGVLVGSPGLDAALRLPEARVPATRMLADARAVRDAVVPYAATFVANGRTADFLERLDGAIAALEASVMERARTAQLQAAAAKGLREEIRRGRKAVAMVDAIVQVHFRAQPAMLAAWRAARRMQAVRGRSAGAADAARDTEVTPRVAA